MKANKGNLCMIMRLPYDFMALWGISHGGKMRFPLLVILTGFLTGSPEAGAFSLSEFQEKMRNHVGTLSGKTAASVRMELL